MKTRINENGSAAVIAIVIAALVVGGGVAAYFATDGFGTNKDDEQTVSGSNSDTSPNDVAEEAPSEDDPIPAGFPSDMPIYQPSEVVTSREKDGGYRLGLQAKDASEEDVISFYKTELASAGWTTDPNLASSSVLEVSKGDWSGSITVVESKTTNIGTTISYILDKN